MHLPYNRRLLIAIGLFFVAGLFSLSVKLHPAIAAEPLTIQFANFSRAATFVEPVDDFSSKIEAESVAILGADQAIAFTRLESPLPDPNRFDGDLLKAVGAGGPLAGSDGLDAANVPGARLNPVWGSIYNSGIPFGPSFDEYLGFLLGSSGDEQPHTMTGLQLLQQTLDQSNANVVVLPITGSTEQESGYFPKPVGDVDGFEGIGLAGLCTEPWVFRYLPPAQNVLDGACDQLLADGVINEKGISFTRAASGGGILDAVIEDTVQAFELFTPSGNLAALFQDPDRNPGTAGARFVHFPSWHQPFLITYMIINRDVWNQLTDAQQHLLTVMSRESLLATYVDHLSLQGDALAAILSINDDDDNPANNMKLSHWPDEDLARLRAAAEDFLAQRVENPEVSVQDREAYQTILAKLRGYMEANDIYWTARSVRSQARLRAQ
ncbi:MAG: hypothetical protein AAFW75_00080 [Cyanobacteria bacterium J06636_16]